jgi:spore germination protein YaaH
MAGPPPRWKPAWLRERAGTTARVPRRAALAAGGLIVVVVATVGFGLATRPGAVSPAATDADRSAAASAGVVVHPVPGHELYGFVPYWEMDDTIAAHVAKIDATTIGLFSVTHTSRGRLATSESGYRRITGPIGRAIIANAHEQGRRVEITWTSFGREKNAALFASASLQAAVVTRLVALVGTLHADGIAVDVETIDDFDIPAYGVFVNALRTALRAANPEGTVTATTTAGPQGAALAVAANLAGADRIFLMGYDYRTGSNEPGALAPLARTDGDQRTLAWSLDTYAAAGIPSTRLLLGLPLYGLAWPVDSPDVGAPATGSGVVWVPRRNLGALRDRSLTSTTDPVEQVAFLAVPRGPAWTAVYYDTPGTLTPKLALADARGLAGAGLWAVGYDRGVPGYQDLFAAFRRGRLDPAASQPVP